MGDARKLELIYGPGQEGIEKMDLLVGDMYEKKPEASFALSETSFIIFLLMASRRLEADPYLNQYYNETYYTEIGLKHVKDTVGLVDLLDRHYPDLAKDFKDRNQSAFKPTLGPADWVKAIEKGVVPKSMTSVWADTKEKNKKFFDELEEESKNYNKNLKSNGSSPVSTQVVYILLAVLLFVIPFFMHQIFADYEPLRKLGIRKLWPVDTDIERELGYSNCRHVDTFLRIYHLPTNPLIFISQVYLMDKTPTLASLPFGIRLNMGGVYFLFLATYGLFADLYSGVIVLAWLYIFYKLATNGSYYDWNLFQLFIIQQHITVYNVIDVLGIYPSFSE